MTVLISFFKWQYVEETWLNIRIVLYCAFVMSFQSIIESWCWWIFTRNLLLSLFSPSRWSGFYVAHCTSDMNWTTRHSARVKEDIYRTVFKQINTSHHVPSSAFIDYNYLFFQLFILFNIILFALKMPRAKDSRHMEGWFGGSIIKIEGVTCSFNKRTCNMYTKVRDNSPWREELTRDWHWQVPFVPLYSNTCPALYIYPL